METLSSNTLFHFTSKPEYLINVLLEGFKPRYCMEDFSMFEFVLGKGNTDLAIPMVCFCDIPLSKVKDHVSKYGNYGIGLTKEWGAANKVSPLIYVNESSATTIGLSSSISNLQNQLKSLRATSAEILGPDLYLQHLDAAYNKTTIDRETLSPEQASKYDSFKKLLALEEALYDAYIAQLRVLRFTKPYFAEEWRKWTKVRFYDEREWRFVPDIQPKDAGLPPWIFKDTYEDEMGRELLNYNIGKQFPLKFKPEDIKYIIVEKESQVPAIIRQIDDSNKYSNKAIKTMLKSKVLTKQQIYDDF